MIGSSVSRNRSNEESKTTFLFFLSFAILHLQSKFHDTSRGIIISITRQDGFVIVEMAVPILGRFLVAEFTLSASLFRCGRKIFFEHGKQLFVEVIAMMFFGVRNRVAKLMNKDARRVIGIIEYAERSSKAGKAVKIPYEG